MLKLDHITKRYGDVPAVDDLTLEIPDACTCVLIGPSGCGKTTTIRIINRLIEPDSGTVFINGVDTATLKPEILRRSIGYAIQNVGLFPHLTIAENIATVPRLLHWPKSRIEQRIDECLRLVGLNPGTYRGKYPHQLSGGEAQRVGVIRAMAADPPILLMDEPFGAVDPLTRQNLQSEFARIQQQVNKTVILVTHDLDEAIRLGNRIAVMKSGKIIQYDSPDVILARPVNEFVRKFVGTDRALKRLSRMKVKGFVRPVPLIGINEPMQAAEAAFDNRPSLWVIDENHRPVGWLDRESITGTGSVSESMTGADLAEVSVYEGSTLRLALSRMLEQGFHELPVIDDAGHIIGEITLGDIEAATAQRQVPGA